MVYQCIYRWKIPIYKISAQEAGEHIQKLVDKYGEVTPQILLDDARSKDSLLHSCYEWDDSKAAEKHRLNQSKQIIANLVVVSMKNGIQSEPTNAFITIKERNERASYISVARAVSNKVTKDQVMKNALAELKMFEHKYGALLNVSELLRNFATEIEEQSA